MKKVKLGIALSGGGMRGIAHAGVLKALEESGIKIEAIGGASSGAIIAGLYVLGYSPEDIYHLFRIYAKDIIGKGKNHFFSLFFYFFTFYFYNEEFQFFLSLSLFFVTIDILLFIINLFYSIIFSFKCCQHAF